MNIVRPIRHDDLNSLLELAENSSIGLINLPKNRSALKQIIEESIRSFEAAIEKPNLEKYTFVLENSETGELGGTCAISSRMGVTEPNYYFRIETIQNEFTRNEMQILKLVSYPIGPTEICALYLKPECRKEGLGKLLSLSRFMFIANHKNRFEEHVVAEMRGYIKEGGIVPFWENICRKFLDLPYDDICELALENRSFVPHVMPQWPLYVSLLPKEVQDALGKTHDSTFPALKMLYSEGFTFTHEVDPFDGGPKISCKTDEISTIKSSKTAIVLTIDEPLTGEEIYLVSNTKLDFRGTYSKLTEVDDRNVTIPIATAKALELKAGDQIRYLKISRKEPAK